MNKLELYLQLREHSLNKEGKKFQELVREHDANRITAYFVSNLNDDEAATLTYDESDDMIVFTGHKRMNMQGFMKRTKKCPTSKLHASRR